MRPSDDHTFVPPPAPEPDVPDPDCATFDDHGKSESSSPSTGQFETDCGAVKKILDKYLPVWRQHKVPIHTSYCGNDPSDQAAGISGTKVFCASWSAINRNWLNSGSIYRRMGSSLWDVYQHIVIHEYAHVLNNQMLIQKGGSNLIQRYTGADNEKGWPAMDDLDPWSELLSDGGDGQNAVHQGLDKTGSVDELLADCIAQDAFPVVKGGYWLRDVPGNSSGCTQGGMRSARRFAYGGQR
jgi:hypothetical protein